MFAPRYVIYAGTAVMKLDSEGNPTKELAEAWENMGKLRKMIENSWWIG